ncbi:unnamed protein product [Phaeothamnion confervicola]
MSSDGAEEAKKLAEKAAKLREGKVSKKHFPCFLRRRVRRRLRQKPRRFCSSRLITSRTFAAEVVGHTLQGHFRNCCLLCTNKTNHCRDCGDGGRKRKVEAPAERRGNRRRGAGSPGKRKARNQRHHEGEASARARLTGRGPEQEGWQSDSDRCRDYCRAGDSWRPGHLLLGRGRRRVHPARACGRCWWLRVGLRKLRVKGIGGKRCICS